MGQIHNELRHAGAIQRALQIALGITDGEAGLERVSETLSLNLDLWSRPEWAAPRDELLWADFLLQSKVALEFGFIAIINPSTSGSLSIVEDATVRTRDASGNVQMGITTEAAVVAAQDAAAGCTTRDRRRGGSSFQARTLIARGGAAAIFGAAATYLEAVGIASSTTMQPLICLPIVLRPGDAYFIEHTVVNLDVEANIRGYERLCMPLELRA